MCSEFVSVYEKAFNMQCMCDLTDLTTGFICTRQISFSSVNLRILARRGARAKFFGFYSNHWNDIKFWRAESAVIRFSMYFQLVISLFFSAV